MSVLGQNPDRDKKAHDIIYGGMSVYVGALKVAASFMGIHGGMGNDYVKGLKDKAWKIYCETGEISKAVKVFFWDP